VTSAQLDLGALLGSLLNNGNPTVVECNTAAGEKVVGGGAFVTGALLGLVVPSSTGPTANGAIITVSNPNSPTVATGWGAQFGTLSSLLGFLSGNYGVSVVCSKP